VSLQRYAPRVHGNVIGSRRVAPCPEPPALIFARERQHVVSHVEAIGPARRAVARGGEQNVDAPPNRLGAGSEAGLQLLVHRALGASSGEILEAAAANQK
jgi:hypothetical protein